MNTRRVHRPLSCIFLLLWNTGCSDLGSDPGQIEDPDPTPTWEGGIGALLTDRCGACHRFPPSNGAPSGFRLDRYDRADAGGGIDGAFEQRDRIRARAADAGSMPPGGPLPLDDRTELEAWLDAGAPRS